MVIVEIKSLGQRLTINQGRIVDGDMHFAPAVKKLAKSFANQTNGDDLDYWIAQELVALHGGRIEKRGLFMHGTQTGIRES